MASCLWWAFGIALPLFVALSATWFWWILTTNEDVSDPSWVDYVSDAIAVLMVFPVGLLFWGGAESWTHVAMTFFCLFADSFFWGFVGVLLYRAVRRYIWKRRAMPPNTALEPTATAP